MIAKVLLISLLLAVSAQRYLPRIPYSCTVPQSPPRCMHSKPTSYFQSCGIYNGGDCPRFCHALQAQYWARQSFRRRCFNYTPSLAALKHIYAWCVYRCGFARTRILRYRAAGPQKIYPKSRFGTTGKKSPVRSSRFTWKKSNIKALIYLGVDAHGLVTSRFLVYTTNTPIRCFRNKDGTETCSQTTPKKGPNRCICSSCWRHRANCPKCCKYAGHIWV